MDEQLKVIDLAVGKEAIGGDENAAQDLLALLATTLPEHQEKIDAAILNQDRTKLITEVHKLHGAVCYTGTPRLRVAAYELEMALKANEENLIATLILQLQQEIDAFFKAYKIS